MKKNKVRDPRIDNDPSFIHAPEHGNNLKAFVDAHPDGVSFRVIAEVMQISTREAEELYKKGLAKLKQRMVE